MTPIGDGNEITYNKRKCFLYKIRKNITPIGDGNVKGLLLEKDMRNKKEYNSDRRRKLL